MLDIYSRRRMCSTLLSLCSKAWSKAGTAAAFPSRVVCCGCCAFKAQRVTILEVRNAILRQSTHHTIHSLASRDMPSPRTRRHPHSG